MSGCRGHCKGPLTKKYRIESSFDPKWGPRVVLHDAQRCNTVFERLAKALTQVRSV